MNTKRIAAITLIFIIATAGWGVLGTATDGRTLRSSEYLGEQVEALWGLPLVQQAPTFSVEVPGTETVRWLMPTANNITVRIDADHRQKGLIWYSTYVADFDGIYTIVNDDAVVQKVKVHFDFPAEGGTYDAFVASIDGVKLTQDVNTREGISELIALEPGKTAEFRVAYKTRGLDSWQYVTDQHAGRVRNFDLNLETDFKNVDFADGSLSPMAKVPASGGGLSLSWQAEDLITQQNIGVLVPAKLNPGPLTARITFFAPVCLLFFFVLVATINILYKVEIHPMHYLFVAAGFFSFHLLFAYLVDVINVHLAFLLAAVIAVALVTSYLTAALRGAFPRKVAIAGQLFYLVLFSYSFFLQGMTGLTIAIGSVVTLAMLMKVTAHLDWNDVFKGAKKETATPPRLPSADVPVL
ncbi:MAG: inner membrane CreD family protein [Candidatus Hydrogenedentes bacterium]|nr:inner membrane CreD family protein [Candidatus Hydrogenedentota bacterium]